MADSDFNLSDLNTVDTSVENWKEFIDSCVTSDFYKIAHEAVGVTDRAASITLLNQYLNIFEEDIREKIINDPEIFYKYAKGFIEELSPYRHDGGEYDPRVRSLYLTKIRNLLREIRNRNGEVKDKERYIFICTLVRFLSSLKYITNAYDMYREYHFRILPQINS